MLSMTTAPRLSTSSAGLAVSDSTQTRLLALIGAFTGPRREFHTGGHPLIPEKMLPLADVVILVANDEPGAMLFRYTAHGEFGGDTLHASVAEAKQQAADEYGAALLPWEEVPPEVTDVHAHAIQYAAQRLNDRGNW
jgi:hypothetical protein